MTVSIGVFSIQEFEQRLQDVQEQAGRKGYECLIAFSGYPERDGHVAYLTNYHIPHPNTMSHEGLGYAAAIIPQRGNLALIAPGGCGTQTVYNCETVREGANLIRETANILKSMGLSSGKIGIAGMDIIPAEYFFQLQKDLPQATLVNADEVCENQRMIKSSVEIELLKQTARLAIGMVEAGLDAVKPDISGWQIEKQMLAAGSDAGIDLIPRIRINSGKSICQANWPRLDRRKIEKGDFVLLEAGGWYRGYGFECTRVAIAGEGSREQHDFLEHLSEAAEWMFGTLKTGVPWTYYLAESRAREIRAAGNGIGLEICERPIIQIEKTIKLKPGMVLSIKPSVSSSQFGRMAVSDMVLIAETGAELMTAHPNAYAR